MMQYLPFADAKALAVYDVFERGAYQLVSASGRNFAISGRLRAGQIFTRQMNATSA